MAAFADQESTDMTVFFNADEYGHAAVYIAPGTEADDGIDVTVRLDETSETTSEWAGGLATARRIVMQRAEVSNPVRQAVIKLASEYWQIQRVISQDEHTTALECVQTFRPRR